jgi:hypothetical protein
MLKLRTKSRRGWRDIEHTGWAHDEAELEMLRAPGGPLPATSSRMGRLLNALAHPYDVPGFDRSALWVKALCLGWYRIVPPEGLGEQRLGLP